jgi:hypothetical protein
MNARRRRRQVHDALDQGRVHIAPTRYERPRALAAEYLDGARAEAAAQLCCESGGVVRRCEDVRTDAVRGLGRSAALALCICFLLWGSSKTALSS